MKLESLQDKDAWIPTSDNSELLAVVIGWAVAVDILRQLQRAGLTENRLQGAVVELESGIAAAGHECRKRGLPIFEGERGT